MVIEGEPITDPSFEYVCIGMLILFVIAIIMYVDPTLIDTVTRFVENLIQYLNNPVVQAGIILGVALIILLYTKLKRYSMVVSI